MLRSLHIAAKVLIEAFLATDPVAAVVPTPADEPDRRDEKRDSRSDGEAPPSDR